MRLRAAALAVYIAVAALTTWPLIAHLSSPLAGRRAVDNPSLQTFFLRSIFALTHDLALSYNLILLASLVAAACAMFAFARSVTGSWWGALIAGLAWGFWPYHFAHFTELSAQAVYFTPLSFLFLHRVMAGRRMSDALGLGVTTALQTLASVASGAITIVGLTAAAMALAVAIGRWRSATIGRLLIVSALLTLVLVAPGLWLLEPIQVHESGAIAALQPVPADDRSGAIAPFVNLLYGSTGILDRIADADHALFPGVTIIALALLGLARARRRDAHPLALAMALVILVGLGLSLTADVGRAAVAPLHTDNLHLSALAPRGRFGILVVFGLSVLAATGVRDVVTERRRRAGLLPAALAALVCLEYTNLPAGFERAAAAHATLGRVSCVLYSDSHSTRA